MIINANFHVDVENKVVICELKCDLQLEKHPAWMVINPSMWEKKFPNIGYDGEFTVRAKARCNASDTFDETVGKRIAESKAKVKMFKIASRVWETCRGALTDMAAKCYNSYIACNNAKMIENNHVLELIR